MSVDTGAQHPGIFGPMVSAADVERAVLAVLRMWFDTYLVEVERRREMELRSTARPKTWRVSADWRTLPEDQLPAIVVRSPGTNDDLQPRGDGEGTIGISWTVELGAVVAARSMPSGYSSAMQKARDWALVMRSIALQQRDEQNLVAHWDVLSEAYDVMDSSADRTTCLAYVELSCWVPEASQRYAGPIGPFEGPIDPANPPDPESPEWPVAESADVEVLNQGD